MALMPVQFLCRCRKDSTLILVTITTLSKQPVVVSAHAVNGLTTPGELSDFEDSYDGLHLPARAYKRALPGTSRQRWMLDIKLHCSQLMQSLQAASAINEAGVWEGQQEDESLRLELQETCLKMQRMLTPANDTIQNIALAHHLEAALQYAVCNDLAKHVPTQNTITYDSLAAKASVDQTQCRRLLRLLISHGVFREPIYDHVAHTPASMSLLDPNVRAWAEYQTTDSMKSSTCLAEALTKWPGSPHQHETAFNLAHDTDLPMYKYFNRAPGKMERFRKAMAGMAHNPALSTSHALAGYPWRDLKHGASIVDIGGGNGHVYSALIQSFPSFKMTVQDIGVAADHVKDGIDFAKYDFFTSYPVRGANVYFMRQLLEDWADENAIRILQNQTSAMGPYS